VYADWRPGEIRHSRANIEKAKKLLGYEPRTGLEQGVRLTWEAMAGEGE
jgi:nucleoside-diphosphate-sugar epimerase